MNRPLLLAFVAFALTVSLSVASAADTTFRLVSPSDQEIGCFGPCACPVQIRSPMDGTFRMASLGSDPTADSWAVSAVDWKIATENGAMHVVGSGSYFRRLDQGRHRMILDLSIDGAAPLRFDSDWDTIPPNVIGTPGLWWIDIAVSRRQNVCFDSVFTISAGEQGAGVGGAVPQLRMTPARPSPFRDRVDLGFVLASEERVDLGVFEASGRRVRTLIADAVLSRGLHSVHWDGIDDQGRRVPAGVLFVRLRTPHGSTGTTVVRVR